MKKLNVIKIGKKLQSIRRANGYTQEKLAERAGLTSQTISTAETGTKALRPWNIVKLCSAMEISADYLLFGKTSDTDLGIISQKVSALSPEQYRHLENIINSFLAAVKTGNNDENNCSN